MTATRLLVSVVAEDESVRESLADVIHEFRLCLLTSRSLLWCSK